MSDQTMSATIYIDGKKHRATPLCSHFYVDHPSLPGRFCAQHSLTHAAVMHLYAGGAVRTSGHRYSLSPDKAVDEVSTAPAPVPVLTLHPTLWRRIWARLFNS